MKFISRADQVRPASGLKTFMVGGGITDALLDTQPLPRPVKALRWRSEADVHSGLKITDKLRNTNQFFSSQAILVRDEVRQITWVTTIETDGIYLSRVEGTALTSRVLLALGTVERATLALVKYSGLPVVAYVLNDAGQKRLFVNDREIQTGAGSPDFPSLAIEQPPIGFAGLNPPKRALLAYKSSTTGHVFSREFDPVSLKFGAEVDLQLPLIFGGISLAVSDGKTVAQAEAIAGDTVVPIIIRSADFLATPTPPTPVDLTTVPHSAVVPGRARLFIDTTGAVHSSLLVQNGSDFTALDVHLDDDRIVAAVSGQNAAHSVIEAFPKMPSLYDTLRFGYGDGETDGAGVIATLLSTGRLLAANSQSGGYVYPSPTLLNDDMQKMYLHAQTECYTRGRPNYVSMDYAFVEADEAGEPVSSELWLETWDMPLPVPQIETTWNGDTLQIRILKDGWFFPGQTAFTIEPTIAEITKAEFVDYREMKLEFNDPARVRGTTLTFETKNVFFYYQASVRLEQGDA